MENGMTKRKLWHGAGLAAAATMATAVVTASAQTPPAATEPEKPAGAPAAEAPPPGYWINGIHLSAQIEGGITGNFAGPKQNFGQLTTDKPNTVLLNQIIEDPAVSAHHPPRARRSAFPQRPPDRASPDH